VLSSSSIGSYFTFAGSWSTSIALSFYKVQLYLFRL
jgi:hypothetical protein